MQRARVEVHICPAQPEQLTLTHARSDRHHVQGFEPVALDRLEEPPALLGTEHLELPAHAPRRGDQARHKFLKTFYRNPASSVNANRLNNFCSQ